MRPPVRHHVTRRLAPAVLVAAGLALAACGGGSPSNAPGTGAASAGSSGSGAQVLPVTDNPITNDSTAATLRLDSVLVENNVDPATGLDVTDHLEITLANTGATDLSNVEVFTTFTDPTTNTEESYYTKLPTSFSIPAGGTRVVHFDDTGAPDHFPVNKFSLYATSTNALDVSVVVSADGAAVQTVTVHKDAGGAENPDE
jgi:hypothetical protein